MKTSSQKPIVLASRSPRRVDLMKEIAADFQVVPSSVEEIIRPQCTPEENAIAIAQAKAEEVARGRPGQLVIGADTLVVLDGEIIGKPVDKEDARNILRRLSGREHQVITGIAIVDCQRVQAAAVSKVKIKPLSEDEIAAYVESGEPMDKAGAYAIQGRGARLVESYSGSYSNIVGLPVETLKDLLEKVGYRPENARESS